MKTSMSILKEFLINQCPLNVSSCCQSVCRILTFSTSSMEPLGQWQSFLKLSMKHLWDSNLFKDEPWPSHSDYKSEIHVAFIMQRSYEQCLKILFYIFQPNMVQLNLN